MVGIRNSSRRRLHLINKFKEIINEYSEELLCCNIHAKSIDEFKTAKDNLMRSYGISGDGSWLPKRIIYNIEHPKFEKPLGNPKQDTVYCQLKRLNSKMRSYSPLLHSSKFNLYEDNNVEIDSSVYLDALMNVFKTRRSVNLEGGTLVSLAQKQYDWLAKNLGGVLEAFGREDTYRDNLPRSQLIDNDLINSPLPNFNKAVNAFAKARSEEWYDSISSSRLSCD